jgi:hypothetical protein
MRQSFTVVKDPRVSATPEDFKAQLELLLGIRDKLSQAGSAVNRMRDLRQQIDGWRQRLEGRPDSEELVAMATALSEKLLSVEKPLIVPGLKTPSEQLNQGVRLLDKLATLSADVYSADFKPTDAACAVYARLAGEIEAQLALLQELLDSDVAAFNAAIRQAGFSALLTT